MIHSASAPFGNPLLKRSCTFGGETRIERISSKALLVGSTDVLIDHRVTKSPPIQRYYNPVVMNLENHGSRRPCDKASDPTISIGFPKTPQQWRCNESPLPSITGSLISRLGLDTAQYEVSFTKIVEILREAAVMCPDDPSACTPSIPQHFDGYTPAFPVFVE